MRPAGHGSKAPLIGSRAAPSNRGGVAGAGPTRRVSPSTFFPLSSTESGHDRMKGLSRAAVASGIASKGGRWPSLMLWAAAACLCLVTAEAAVRPSTALRAPVVPFRSLLPVATRLFAGCHALQGAAGRDQAGGGSLEPKEDNAVWAIESGSCSPPASGLPGTPRWSSLLMAQCCCPVRPRRSWGGPLRARTLDGTPRE